MAQENKLCPICNTVGHSKFYCKDKEVKPLKRSPLNRTSKKNLQVVKTKKKAPTRSQLVKKLDKVFSEYIRLRDDGKGCVTCGEIKPWREMQNCHFYSRGRQNTRWEETNCHSGCYRCNVLLKGNYISYTIYMIDTYGREHVDYLEALSKSTNKITTVKLKEMIEYYTNVVQSIDKT